MCFVSGPLVQLIHGSKQIGLARTALLCELESVRPTARQVTFAQASPRLGVATVAFTGVRSFGVDAFAILAFVGHAALINVCQGEWKRRLQLCSAALIRAEWFLK